MSYKEDLKGKYTKWAQVCHKLDQKYARKGAFGRDELKNIKKTIQEVLPFMDDLKANRLMRTVRVAQNAFMFSSGITADTDQLATDIQVLLKEGLKPDLQKFIITSAFTGRALPSELAQLDNIAFIKCLECPNLAKIDAKDLPPHIQELTCVSCPNLSLENMDKISQLKSLKVTGCGPAPVSWEPLSKMRALERLYLDFVPSSPQSAVGGAKKLTGIAFSGENIRELPQYLEDLKALHWLTLTNTIRLEPHDFDLSFLPEGCHIGANGFFKKSEEIYETIYNARGIPEEIMWFPKNGVWQQFLIPKDPPK